MEGSDIENLPAQPARVETGPLQFGDDWPGYFIRGDEAIALASSIEWLASGIKDMDAIDYAALGELQAFAKALKSVKVGRP